MKIPFPGCLIIFLTAPFLLLSVNAQSWHFEKEKEGIKMYTRTETGKPIKSYMGVTDINAPAEKIFAMLEDVNHTDWWDKNISQMKVFRYEKNVISQYYIVYDLPWPVTDRDLCVTATVKIDKKTGQMEINAVPFPGKVPENKEMVRIKEYKQSWIVKSTGPNSSHVVLEGYANPAGTVPDWLTNMLIVDSPYKIMSEVKKRMEK